MHSKKLVSIITPSFNQATYLETCIQSVLAQKNSFDADFELEYLVVDGGSTDGSLDIINKYTSHIKWWVSEADSGQADAINKGLEHAQGEIVAWINSDDLYLPNAISQAVLYIMSNSSLGLIYGDAISIDPRGEIIKKWAFGDWGLPELMRFRVICQPAVFINRAIVGDDVKLNSNFHYMLDHHLWIQIARFYSIQHVPQLWAAARTHSKAKNVLYAAKFGEEIFNILEWMQTLSDLAPIVHSNSKKIKAGAYRLKARYLLDGGLSSMALMAYLAALKRDPRYAMQHWHRMVYALLDMIGAGWTADWYYKNRRRLQSLRIDTQGLENWPGIIYP